MLDEDVRALFDTLHEEVEAIAADRGYGVRRVWSDEVDPDKVYWRLLPEDQRWDSRFTIKLRGRDAGEAWLQQLDGDAFPLNEEDGIPFTVDPDREAPFRVGAERFSDARKAAEALVGILEPDAG